MENTHPSFLQRNRWRIVGIAVLIPVVGFALYWAFITLVWMIPQQPTSRAAGLADLDGDGDLDLLLASGVNEGSGDLVVWWNRGGQQGGAPGQFTDTDKRHGQLEYMNLAAGDLDGDRDVDILLGNAASLILYLNEGGAQGGKTGELAPNEIWLRGGNYWGGHHPIALGDVNSDGTLDAVAANCCGGMMFGDGQPVPLPPYATVWINQSLAKPGSRSQLGYSGDPLESRGTMDLALGDLDGDGDLDFFAANAFWSLEPAQPDGKNLPDQVWLNDGRGNFTDSGQRLGDDDGRSVALGDLDGDGDLDALVGSNGPGRSWLNDGKGNFSDSGQRFGNAITQKVFLADLDGDGDLDAIFQTWTQVEFWQNDGRAQFTRAVQCIVLPVRYAVAVGDVDGDGTPDLVAGMLDQQVKVWLNDGKNWFQRRF